MLVHHSTSTAALLFYIEGLLCGNLLLKAGDLLFRFVHLRDELHHARPTTARPPKSHRVLLAELLEYFDLMEKWIEEDQRLRSQRLVENLWIQVTGLHGHLNLLNENTELRWRRLASSAAATSTTRHA